MTPKRHSEMDVFSFVTDLVNFFIKRCIKKIINFFLFTCIIFITNRIWFGLPLIAGYGINNVSRKIRRFKIWIKTIVIKRDMIHLSTSRPDPTRIQRHIVMRWVTFLQQKQRMKTKAVFSCRWHPSLESLQCIEIVIWPISKKDPP